MGTYSAAVLTKNRSRYAGALLSAAAAGVSTLTVDHNLGRSPHAVYPLLRSIISIGVSGIYVPARVTGWDASQVTLTYGHATAPAQAELVDVVCEYTHSLVR